MKSSVGKFGRFIEYLLANQEPCKVAAQLQREHVDLQRVFAGLQVYIEGRSIASDRRKHHKADLNIINRGVREYGVDPAVGAWLRDRSELARSIDGLSRVHNVDSLASVQLYLELRTKRQATMSELAYLIDAANWAMGRMGRKMAGVDPKNIERELRRHRQKNERFLKILRDDIASKL